MKKKIALAAATLVFSAALVFAWNLWGPAGVPAGQEPLRHLDAAAYSDFKTAFNRNSGAVRIVALLSPT